MEAETTIIVVGGGLAGVTCALELKDRHPDFRVRVAEMGPRCLEGLRRMAPMRCPPAQPGESVEDLLDAVFRGRDAARHLLHRFDADAFRSALADWPRTPDARVDLAAAAGSLEQRLEESGVECVPGRKASEIALPGADGLFRIWFDVGNPWEAHALVLAMGGGRHRGLGWVQEWGHVVRRGQPAFLSLRLSENRWRGVTSAHWPATQVTWRDPATGESVAARGDVIWRFPFLEGSAVSAVTGRAGDRLREAGLAGSLELALPDLKERGLDINTLQQRVQQGGSKPVADDVPAEFDGSAWRAIVKGARIQPGESWSRLSRRQVQTLAGHLARLTVKFSGARQWKDEFSIQGGLDPDQFHAGTLESRMVPRLYVIGEMLDIDGAPGGTNLHLALASAHAAAAALATR